MFSSIRGCFIFVVVYCLSSHDVIDGAAVMSVDLGSEFIKIAVVSPGLPMEIALNGESKRKTPMAVAFRNGERLIGSDALSTAIKYPRKAYIHFLDLIGKHIDHPQVKRFQSNFPDYVIKAASYYTPGVNDSIVFVHDEKLDADDESSSEMVISPTELVAMVLENARNIAESFSQQKIKDVVLTIPAYFDMIERRELMVACKLANINCLQLISNPLGVALNYGIFRLNKLSSTSNTTRNVIFYDMGSQSTTVSAVTFSSVETKEKGFTQTFPEACIKGVTFDRSLGGLSLVLSLQSYLATEFNKFMRDVKGVKGKDVFKIPRAMAKLRKEAERVKTVLSANPSTPVQIENVMDDIDFSGLEMTRDKLVELMSESSSVGGEEANSKEYFGRVVPPLERVVKVASGFQGNVDEIIIIGGGTRVPKVQELLNTFIKDNPTLFGNPSDNKEEYVSEGSTLAPGGKVKELSKNLNSDESAAMGAVYKAADLSSGFKVKKFLTKEAVLHPIEVDYSRKLVTDDENSDDESADSDSTPADPDRRTIVRTLFGPFSSFPGKKIMSFNKHDPEHFDFNVNFNHLDATLTQEQIKDIQMMNLTTYGVRNISTVMRNYTEMSLDAEKSADKKSFAMVSKGIKAHFVLDNSGFLILNNVDAHFEREISIDEQIQEINLQEDARYAKLDRDMKKMAEKDNNTQETGNSNSTEGEDSSSSWTDTFSNLFSSTDDEENNGTNKDESLSSKTTEEKSNSKKDESKSENKKKSKKKSVSNDSETHEDKVKRRLNFERIERKKIANEFEKKKKNLKVKILTAKHDLDFEIVKNHIPLDMYEEAWISSSNKLKILNDRDAAKKNRESLLNQLESEVISLRGKVEDIESDQNSLSFKTLSFEEKNKINELCSQISEWIDEEYMLDTDVAELETRLTQLREASEPWISRIQQHLDVEEQSESMMKVMTKASEFLSHIQNASEMESGVLNLTDIQSFKSQIENVEKWFKEDVMTQPSLDIDYTKPPSISASQIQLKSEEVQEGIKEVLNKIKVAKERSATENEESKSKKSTKKRKLKKNKKDDDVKINEESDDIIDSSSNDSEDTDSVVDESSKENTEQQQSTTNTDDGIGENSNPDSDQDPSPGNDSNRTTTEHSEL